MDGNAASWFIDRHVAEGRGDRTAFIDPDRRITYAGLAEETAQFAAALQAAGLHREQRLALVLRDSIAFPVAFWGALRAGVVPIPINTLLPAELIRYILADSRASAVVISASLLPALAPMLAALPAKPLVVLVPEADAPAPQGAQPLDVFLAEAGPARPAPVDAHPDEVAFWLYSSGSTSAPKGVRHVHASLRATYETYGRHVLGIAADDLVFSAAKLFFAYGLGNAMTFPMAVGAAAILFPHRPTLEAVLAVMATHRPTIFGGVPTLYAGLLGQPDLPPGAGSDRLRRCISAGEALPEHLGTAWERRVGVEILDGLGSTEMLHIFLSNRPGAVRYGCSGQAVPGYDLRLVDEAGADVPDGEQGELLVRGPSAAEGYWNQREKSRQTFAGLWTHTGDKYTREPDGTYRCIGRMDDIFKVSGIWVSPYEVEAALGTHPAVAEAAVVGDKDAEGLTKPRAFVVLRPNADHEGLAEALKQHVKDRAGPWKYPRWISFVPELPKTATGKIQRFKLRGGG